LPDGAGANERDRWARAVRRLRSRRFRVSDRSMAPTLLPGDCLYVDKGAYREQLPVRGDLVVVQDPEVADRFLVKRVVSVPGDPTVPPEPQVPPGTVYLLGDNLPSSRDSRAFGPVPLARVLGRAWFRYAPLERRGPLPSPNRPSGTPSKA
jgi:signal peptidase I